MAEWLKLALEILSAGFGAAVSCAVFAWHMRGWIDHQFATTRKIVYQELEKHEAKDQTRHLQNLAKFTDIYLSLATAGIRIVRAPGGNGNGNGNEQHN